MSKIKDKPATKPVSKVAVKIFKGGPILTMNDNRRQVEAIAIDDRGHILAVGDEAEVMKTAHKKSTEIIDLGGNTLMPSFIDAHGHIMNAPQIIDWANVSGPPAGPVTCIPDIIQVLKEHKDKFSIEPGDDNWIIAYGYDVTNLSEGREVTRYDLDEEFPDYPVLLMHIDADLIRSHEGDTINLANGCMCCSLVNGFAVAMGQIRKRAEDFDHLVIEASGVANPRKVAQYGTMYQLPLEGILVVADAEQVRTHAQNKYVGDTVVRQFAQADLIVVNKIDLVSEAEIASLRSWLANLAPKTPIIATTQSQVPMDVLLGIESDRILIHSESDDDDHADTFETWTIESSSPLTKESLDRFACGLGADIYRAKGFVYLQEDKERRYIYQQVGTRWTLEGSSTWDREQPQTRLVAIGCRGATNLEALEALLGSLHIA